MKWKRSYPGGLLAHTSCNGTYYIDWTGRVLYYNDKFVGEYCSLKRAKEAAEKHKAANK